MRHNRWKPEQFNMPLVAELRGGPVVIGQTKYRLEIHDQENGCRIPIREHWLINRIEMLRPQAKAVGVDSRFRMSIAMHPQLDIALALTCHNYRLDVGVVGETQCAFFAEVELDDHDYNMLKPQPDGSQGVEFVFILSGGKMQVWD